VKAQERSDKGDHGSGASVVEVGPTLGAAPESQGHALGAGHTEVCVFFVYMF
jgi:hypothetical protein